MVRANRARARRRGGPWGSGAVGVASGAAVDPSLGFAALPHVHPDHALTLALERMGVLRYNVLPVVSRADIRQMIGLVTLQDVLEAYGVAKGSQRVAHRD